MADLSEVSTAIANICGTAIYPNGSANPSIISILDPLTSAYIALPCKIYPGWPNSPALTQDLNNGIVNISVYPQPNMERVTTRYPTAWVDQTRNTSTLTAVISGNTVTIGGTVTLGHYITVLFTASGSVSGPISSYAALPGDTLATIAAALAAGVAGSTSVGPVITFPAAMNGRIVTRTAAPGTVLRELGRQQRGYQITVWAPTPDARSIAASAVDSMLRGTDFVTMPDTTPAWLTYRASNDIDTREDALLYRRDVFYWAEYATTQVLPGYPATAIVTEIEADYGYKDIAPAPFGANTAGFVFTPSITVDC